MICQTDYSFLQKPDSCLLLCQPLHIFKGFFLTAFILRSDFFYKCRQP